MMPNVKILVVEDERLVAQDIESCLGRFGYQVTAIVSNGKDALKEAQETPPDLVLMDIILEGEWDGIETARRMRRHLDVPIVYITAYSDEKTLEAAKVTEPYGYILKPIDEKELHIVVELTVFKHASEKRDKDKYERLSLFINPIADTICLLDSDFHVVEMNETGIKSWRLRRDDFRKKDIFDLALNIPGEQKAVYRQKLKRTVNTGIPFQENDIAVVSKTGDRIVNAKAFKAGEGVGLIITDITAQVRTQQALRTSEDRHRMLVENMIEGLAMVDDRGVISFINQKFLEAQGFTPDEVIGHSLAEFVGPKNLEVFQEQIVKRGKGNPEPWELAWKRKDGGEATILASPAPIYENGAFKGSIVVLTDISERRQIEEELGRSYQQLRNLSRHLQSVREEESKRIAREIHDELGQALTALKMDLSWLTSRLPESLPDQRILIDKTRAMTSLIDKTIQTVQKISAELRPGLLDDLGLIAAIEWQCQEFQNRTGIECEVDFDSEVIDLSPDLSTAIFRVFQEALTNAVRHSRATRISVSLKNKPDLLELQICDNGIGIPEKAIDSADSLGIMGMRERLIPFGGSLLISGEVNRGTTLTLSLPVKGLKRHD